MKSVFAVGVRTSEAADVICLWKRCAIDCGRARFGRKERRTQTKPLYLMYFVTVSLFLGEASPHVRRVKFEREVGIGRYVSKERGNRNLLLKTRFLLSSFRVFPFLFALAVLEGYTLQLCPGYTVSSGVYEERKKRTLVTSDRGTQ